MRLSSLLLAMCWLVGCGSGDEPKTVSTANHVECKGNKISCEGAVAIACEDGQAVPEDCNDSQSVCVSGLGCTMCAPGAGHCDGETTQTCSKDGKRWVDGEVCSGEAGVHCQASSGTCLNLCETAARSHSYVGCEYWSISAANIVNKAFDFAVIVSNPQSVPAQIQISAAKSATTAAFDTSDVVMPGELKTFRLPWRLVDTEKALTFTDSAYQLTSSVPVTAYQFNPLEYQLDSDCTGADAVDPDPTDGACYSYSNDASLLLPSSALGSTYLVMAPATARAHRVIVDSTGATLVAEDGTPIEHDYIERSTATIVATEDTTLSIVPSVSMQCSAGFFEAGEKVKLKLRKGEATQLYFEAPPLMEACAGRHDEQSANLSCGPDGTDVCVLLDEYCEGADPTGTRITSTSPIAVYVGSPCSFVPYDRFACDHLEEALPPLNTWGNEVVVGITYPLRHEPNLIRITSAVDGNELVFDPPQTHEAITLDLGEVVEIISTESFAVSGTQPLLVAQYLVGQDYTGLRQGSDSSSGNRNSGDPSLSFAIPIEQYRRDFDFLTPDTYDSSWVTVVSPVDADVRIDGEPMSGWRPIGDSGFEVAHSQLKPGPHSIRAELPVGVQVYGFGTYTSYMFPAGLNLDRVNELL